MLFSFYTGVFHELVPQLVRPLRGGWQVRRPSFRPCLETLEDRSVPSISHAFLGNGQVATLVAFDNGALYEFSPSFTGLVSTGVKDVHAYRDVQGNLGMDVVYNNGNAYQFDSSGGRFLASGVYEASTTFDRFGNFTTVIAFEGTGRAYLFTNTMATLLGTNLNSACTYLDAQGFAGLLVNYQDSAGNTRLYQYDSTQARFLGSNTQEAEANYNFLFSGKGNSNSNGGFNGNDNGNGNGGFNGQFYLDVTFFPSGTNANTAGNSSGDTFEFTQSSAANLGSF